MGVGVCVVTPSHTQLGQFPDDQSGSRLRTLIAHHPPAHVMTERGQRSQRTASILKQSLAGTFKEQLAHSKTTHPPTSIYLCTGAEFWTAETTLEALTGHLGCHTWPQVLDTMLVKGVCHANREPTFNLRIVRSLV